MPSTEYHPCSTRRCGMRGFGGYCVLDAELVLAIRCYDSCRLPVSPSPRLPRQVRTVPITKSPTGLDMHLVADTGYIRVAQVVPKGAAHKAGIQVGDLILAAGDNGTCGNFEITFGPSQLSATSHAPCDMLHMVPMLIGC